MPRNLESVVDVVESVGVVSGLVVLFLLVLVVISIANRPFRYGFALLIGGAIAGLVAGQDPPNLVVGLFALYSLTLVIVFRFGTEVEAASRARRQGGTGGPTGVAYTNVLWFVALCFPLLPLRSLVVNSGVSDGGTVLVGFGLVAYGFALGVWGVALLFAE